MRAAWVMAVWLGFSGCGARDAPPAESHDIVVFAAASLSPALDEIADRFEREQGVRVKRSYASSSTLAKQIDAGAPAHVFVSANPRWVEWLVQRGAISAGRSFELLGNSLVLVAPANAPFAFEPESKASLAGAFEGRLALGDPDHVPAGVYAQGALQRAGWWDELAPRVVRCSDARAALAFVERGECAAGIVYATDAASSRRVVVVAEIPEAWHEPIVYPAAIVGQGSALADRFGAALRESGETFRSHGFRVLANVTP